ncbi:belonging to Uncharacterized protein family UPF0153 [Thraustotheca clavata]|uniref:Belonging to Uncharacterized protein family UPF0153 n=1 Tax=Thraustotheca clavata TaxID=74557 RepID=A0A1V9YRR9_9STRA|nr:belonging to Uncharacterized protein family UPF0153 [Thraustotheca clavata]
MRGINIRHGTRCMSSNPWYKDGLSFTCTKCGNCCSGRAGSVRFADEELTKMADKMKVSVSEFLTKYTRRQGRGSKSFYQLKELRKNQLDGFDCVFLTRQGKQTRCQLYEARPLQCRTWPFWPENTTSKTSWKETSQVCPGVNKGFKHSPDEIRKQLQATINWRQSLTTSSPSRLLKPPSKPNSA